MFRNFVLIAATASIMLVAYGAYTYQDGSLEYARTPFANDGSDIQMPPFEGGELKVRNATIRPGEGFFVEVCQENGDPKYQFRSIRWEPVDEQEFKLVGPEICVFMPGGQKTRIQADHGRIFVERLKKNNLDPRRGRLYGNVVILIDRTDRAWRQAHPELADPEKHPDRVVKIWLDEVRFDLNRSHIKSNGKLRVQSPEVEIEGAGLTLTWNERDNRIEELIIEKGKRMELRRGGSLVSFDLPGREREVTEAPSSRPSPPEKEKAKQDLKQAAAMAAAGVTVSEKVYPSAFIRRALEQGASANRALSINDVPGDKDKARPDGKRSGGADVKPRKPDKPISIFQRGDKRRVKRRKHQIDTYRAAFEGNVVVEQRRGLKMLGRLSGVDRLEMIFDVGEKQRKSLQATPPTSQPAGGTTTSPAAATTAPTTQPEDQTRLCLFWTGRLVLTPAAPEPEQTGKRFDIHAVGRDINILDRQGGVSCRRLIFCNETEQLWLYGSPKKPVRMLSGEARRLQGREIYLDRKTGIAVVNGPGSLMDTRQALAAVGAEGSEGDEKAGKRSQDKDDRIEVTWTKQVELEFESARVTRIDPESHQEVTKRREYIKQAAFRGNVLMKQGNQQIKANEAIILVGVPKSPKDLVGPIEGVRASGGVMLVQQDNEIRSEKLSVTMMVDEKGRAVPKSATAYGNVSAKQGKRQIMAKDLLSVMIGPPRQGTVPVKAAALAGLAGVDPGRLVKLKRLAAERGVRSSEIDALIGKKGLDLIGLRALAVARNIDPEKVIELVKPKQPRTRLAIVEMHAFGDVVAFDPQEKLDVQAEELHCELPDGKTLDNATVVAKPNEQARVEMGDYVIHGHQIEIDIPRLFAEVPDAGWLKFESSQGLDGRQLDEPLPIKITWSKEMKLEGRRNIGRFVGDVVASSQTSRMDCDQLMVSFVDLPPARVDKKRKEATPTTTSSSAATQLAGKPKSSPGFQLGARALQGRFDKRPTAVLAEGNVVAVSSVYDKENRQRLLSRIRIAGPKLSVDLVREQLDVVGSGSLLIEDYRLPSAADQETAERPSRPKDPLMSDLSGRGPSQTVFTWANSMSYFLENNLAVLDRSVNMIHLGGMSMVMAKDLARAMSLDISNLRAKGRKAALGCENLTVEFLQRSGSPKSGMPLEGAGQAELKRLIATGNIYLEDSGKSLIGEELTYFRDKNEITVLGTAGNEARLFVEDTKTGEMVRYICPWFRWNRNTGDIDAPGARVSVVRSSARR